MSPHAGTLAGRRIVVTRRSDQASSLLGLLRDRGATVLEVPATAIGPPEDLAPLDAALRELGRFRWIVFTSANAVQAVLSRHALGESAVRIAATIGAARRNPKMKPPVGPSNTPRPPAAPENTGTPMALIPISI